MKYKSGGDKSRSIDPVLTRKRSPLMHPGGLILAALVILFTAYVFGYAPWVDSAWDHLLAYLNGRRDQATSVFTLAGPAALGLLAILLFYAILKRLNSARIQLQVRKHTAGRPTVSEAAFINMAAAHGVEAKVARHTYRALRPRYGPSMKVDLNDRLRHDLHWRETKLQNALKNLPRFCDRRKNLKADPDAVKTVLDLLLFVESCPKPSLNSAEAAVARRASTMIAAAQTPTKSEDEKNAETDAMHIEPLHKRLRAMPPATDSGNNKPLS